jgi:hypothetical protein
MRYRVTIHSTAVTDLDAVFVWIASPSPENAVPWVREAPGGRRLARQLSQEMSGGTGE